MPNLPLEVQVNSLPNNPGVYQFYDKEGKILYVGKAKNLKKRVASYFSKKHEYGKTRVMVKKIKAIKHIVVNTESDALLLENNLIKEHQPRYNVLLRDDKTYPSICIKNELFPRIFMTRNLIDDGSEYFGPYTSVKTIRTLLELIKNVHPLRTCSHKLSREKIEAGKFKKDLEYHLGNCQGACQGLLSEEEYKLRIAKVREIIKGNFKDSLAQFRNEMKVFAAAMQFEKAQQVKEKIEILENYQAKSTVVNPKINNVDVFSIIDDESYAYINFLQISHGAIIRAHTLEIKKKLDESKVDLLQLGIFDIRRRFNSDSKEIYVPFPLALQDNVKVTVPKLGDKRKILDLSIRNAKFFRQDRLRQIKITDPDRHTKRIMSQMKADLRLSHDPVHIECFDNSNMQGSNPVAACVVFKNGKPAKKEYRHFNIKTVEGPNDFASMEEVVYRRYKRLLDEEQPLPQLVVVDGGKGQLSAGLKSLETLDLRGKVAIIGIAKRLEEIFFPGDPVPLYLDKKSETLKIIQQLRNEAHRFGITFHRNKRSKAAINSELENIEGIGKKTAEQLLKKFKSVKRIKEASMDHLTETIGSSKAKKVYESFR
ncbi:MAG: excinuclease ABC subunit UvrC [Allomuricauda sp.]|nr:MAG: excinuclease ABC subunit UvrC [Allomuricauda sp.]